MRETYILTALLYSDAPFNLLQAITCAHEFIKNRIKRSGSLSRTSIDKYYYGHGIHEPSLIKNVRDAYVHNVNDSSMVLAAVGCLDSSMVVSLFSIFDIDWDVQKTVRCVRRIHGIYAMLDSLEEE